MTPTDLRLSWVPTESELAAWGTVSQDFNPLHFDEEFCRRTPMGQRVVFGALALARLQAELRARRPASLPLRVEVRFVGPMPVGQRLDISALPDPVEPDAVACVVDIAGVPAVRGRAHHLQGEKP